MLDVRLPVTNLYWEGDRFRPELVSEDPHLASRLSGWDGQFALATSEGDRHVLARDKYGVNKLFYAVRADGYVLAANFAQDVVAAGAPFEAVRSVPAGHFTIIDTAARTLRNVAYHTLRNRPLDNPSLAAIAQAIREALETWFARIARDLGGREICICLSGGLDSSLIAALARKHFDRVRGFTYSFVADGHPESEDAHYAQRVAQSLDMPVELIPGSGDDILDAVEPAVLWGQDWRDFNVHCAIVNHLIARHVARSTETSTDRRLFLTGDMMNEIVADYTPIEYAGRSFYDLPRMDIDALRLVLMRGLDAGDREIGVFARAGLDVLQPYGLVAERYLAVTGRHLAADAAKQRLVREIAGDLLPDFVLDRRKVRAQIGTSETPTGILPVLVDAGRETPFFRRLWCEHLGLADERQLDEFIRIGRYRAAIRYPRRGDDNDWLVD